MPGLPLTPIERYFFHDHRESHPAWIRYEFTFQGAFERAAFERAWAQLERRHPLTGATVAERRWGGPVWQLGAARPEWSWGEADALPGKRHDLSARAGLQGVGQVGPAGTKLTLQVHHAVADGLGLLLIAEDLFTLYAIECGATIELPAIPELGRRRERASSGTPQAWRQLPWLMIGVIWGAVLGRQRVVQLRGTDENRAWRGLTARVCAAEELARLRGAARQAGTSLNELLIRDVQVALGAWLQRHGPARPEEWTRVLVPVNVGGARADARSSSNALGVALIDRRVRSLGRRARLLQRAREDMAFIRQRGLMRAFGAGMWLRGLLPGALRRHCRRGGARSTMVFSNLGKILDRGPLVRPDGVLAVPGAELTGFVGWGPCRPGTSLFVLAAEYRGRLSLGVEYDPTVLSATEAEDFADELETQMRHSSAGE